jgi:pimeloyl-ACP methyl ester carboxylesterase
MARVESGFADVNGTRLHYEMSGEGPPMLLLHGFTLDRRMWRPQVEGLSSRFRVVAYDARGFGRSAMPVVGAPHRHCDDAAALCEHLRLGAVIAVGHSIGAHQLLELAIARPDLVRAYASLNGSGLASVPFPQDVLAMFGAIRAAVKSDGIDAAKRIWSRAEWFAAPRERPEVAGALDAMLAEYSGWHWQNDNPATGLAPPAAERLAEVRVPALVVHGERDLAYNDAVARALAEGIRGATMLRLPRAGHMANLEEPAAVNEALVALAARA